MHGAIQIITDICEQIIINFSIQASSTSEAEDTSSAYYDRDEQPGCSYSTDSRSATGISLIDTLQKVTVLLQYMYYS